jgi:hypothetical protein
VAIEFGRKVLYSTERPTSPSWKPREGQEVRTGSLTMATDAKKLQPIIIKRVKKGGHCRAWWRLEDCLRRLCDRHDGVLSC